MYDKESLHHGGINAKHSPPNYFFALKDTENPQDLCNKKLSYYRKGITERWCFNSVVPEIEYLVP